MKSRYYDHTSQWAGFHNGVTGNGVFENKTGYFSLDEQRIHVKFLHTNYIQRFQYTRMTVGDPK